MENKTADIIQETRKLHVKKKSGIIPDQTQTSNKQFQPPQPLLQTDVEIQLKASRDVRWQPGVPNQTIINMEIGTCFYIHQIQNWFWLVIII